MPKKSNKIKTRSKGSIFTFLENHLKLDLTFEKGLPVRYLPYILYLTAIGIFYIGNSYYADKTIRKIDKIGPEVENLRADYTSLKAEYMYASKQSEVASRVKELGLHESSIPPYKIVVKKK